MVIMKNPFKKIRDWWTTERVQIEEQRIREEAQDFFNIERRRTGLGEEYDVILYLGICITDKSDSKNICNKLAELRQVYINDKMKRIKE